MESLLFEGSVEGFKMVSGNSRHYFVLELQIRTKAEPIWTQSNEQEVFK